MYETPNSILAAARELGIDQTRFRQVGPTQFGAVLDQILVTFTRGGTRNRNRLWLWEDLRGPRHTLQGPHDLSRLRDLVSAETPVWLLTEDWDRTKSKGNYWLFEGGFGAVLDVLANHHGLEFYIASRKLEWLLLENHHDIVIGVGEWIVRRLAALPSC